MPSRSRSSSSRVAAASDPTSSSSCGGPSPRLSEPQARKAPRSRERAQQRLARGGRAGARTRRGRLRCIRAGIQGRADRDAVAVTAGGGQALHRGRDRVGVEGGERGARRHQPGGHGRLPAAGQGHPLDQRGPAAGERRNVGGELGDDPLGERTPPQRPGCSRLGRPARLAAPPHAGHVGPPTVPLSAGRACRRRDGGRSPRGSPIAACAPAPRRRPPSGAGRRCSRPRRGGGGGRCSRSGPRPRRAPR